MSEIINAEVSTQILPDDKYLLSNVLDNLWEKR